MVSSDSSFGVAAGCRRTDAARRRCRTRRCAALRAELPSAPRAAGAARCFRTSSRALSIESTSNGVPAAINCGDRRRILRLIDGGRANVVGDHRQNAPRELGLFDARAAGVDPHQVQIDRRADQRQQHRRQGDREDQLEQRESRATARFIVCHLRLLAGCRTMSRLCRLTTEPDDVELDVDELGCRRPFRPARNPDSASSARARTGPAAAGRRAAARPTRERRPALRTACFPMSIEYTQGGSASGIERRLADGRQLAGAGRPARP